MKLRGSSKVSLILFILFCFGAGVSGVYTLISDTNTNEKIEERAREERTSQSLECVQKVAELKASFDSFKMETERKVGDAVFSSATAQAISVEIRDTIKGQVEKAVSKADAASE